MSGPKYVCDKHKKDLEFYCSAHNVLLCSLCIWNHSKHQNRVKICVQDDIKHHTKELKEHLQTMKRQIESLDAKLNEVLEGDGEIRSDDIIRAY